MPWKGVTPVDLRMEFITRLNKGERMSELCAEFGISRKTGYKLKGRFDELGVSGLEDQSRAPKSIPHRTPAELAAAVIAERRKHPTWGPRKLKEVLEKRLGRSLPAASTLGGILDRAGLTERRPYRQRYRSQPTSLSSAHAPNEVWCTDYKGQFRLGDASYCYPLTVTDQFSRYILACDGMPAISEGQARDSMELLFRKYGVPDVMRSDNGPPFATTGLRGLSKLSVYWLRLGIRCERIRPAHPEQNGQHERMHRTLKAETTRPARKNLLQQQQAFDAFVDEFNHERPHEALGMKRPADVYAKSSRKYPDVIPEPDYSLCDDVLTVTKNGSINFYRRRQIYVSAALANQPVGVTEKADGRWLLSFIDLELGHVEKDGSFNPTL